MSYYLTDEEITAMGDAWMRGDFAVRTVSIGRGHWEDVARAVATAASDKAMQWVMDKLIAEDETIAAMFVKTWMEVQG